ncbi:hypothetical protein TNCV_173911 [Trichonephila clavipes]|nr:hypothetical protein TNCV_173911 [Trichonephila clavipes]
MANLFTLCSIVSSLGTHREQNYLKLRSSVAILYTAERETSENSNEGVESHEAVSSLVVRASDSRPEGLGSIPDATKYPPSTHGFHTEIVKVDIGGVATYRPFVESRRAKSYCHLYGAQGRRQAYF